ncbi:glycosyltransferase family 2 protein [Marixanthomonas sp. SCSIO 43207]|uniref:glycosyltransferase family 2 protein n=1 Tax=Marixanthomonas sp. SCSIO 43207 TaxID=2779360 RepID=UPI001CA90D0C|nr:glycosyltransferase family 2 protein [Marixanthomonas sp. SCSIO 43207]UAB81206.1 glycosyltransferase family 2 protein [Marixanthomonas sp. SCSIO 43207]
MIQQLGIVIPYYNAQNHIETVVEKASHYSNHIIVVNDYSSQPLPQGYLQSHESVTIINLSENLGVGGATKAGFTYLENLDTVTVMIKLDADDQMDTEYIPQLVAPILTTKHDFVKGNRFRDFRALKRMPWARRFGNLFLSFLSKVATGYWNCFDFNNGFFALSKEKWSLLNQHDIANNYFFETSLISELYFQKASIKEVAMPAIYGEETSNMNIYNMPFLFGLNLLKRFVSRIWKAYFVYDFNIGSLYLVFGHLLFLSGILFGGINWYHYASKEVLTPLGTIMISALLIILGFQLLLQAIQFDILNTPKNER